MQKKNGISLIVLVITIIVMIILAATIIISLNNTNVMKKANEAVNKTNEATLIETANVAWGEAYAKGERTIKDPDGAGEKVGLKNYVLDYLAKNNMSTEGYIITVTTKGVIVEKVLTKEEYEEKYSKELAELKDNYYTLDNNGKFILTAEGKAAGLTKLAIPYGTVSIAGGTNGNKIDVQELILPSTVTTIQAAALNNLKPSQLKLKEANNLMIIRLNNFDIEGDTNLQEGQLVYFGKVCIGCKGTCPENVVLNEGTYGIAGWAFSNANIKKVTFPSTLKYISEDAFFSCTSLTTINGIEEVKDNLVIEARAFEGTYNIDPEVEEILISINEFIHDVYDPM